MMEQNTINKPFGEFHDIDLLTHSLTPDLVNEVDSSQPTTSWVSGTGERSQDNKELDIKNELNPKENKKEELDVIFKQRIAGNKEHAKSDIDRPKGTIINERFNDVPVEEDEKSFTIRSVWKNMPMIKSMLADN